MSNDTIVITGMGITSAIGHTPEGVWEAIESGMSGLSSLSLFQSPRCGHLPVGEIREDPALLSGLELGSRSDHLAVYASRQAFRAAELERLPAGRRRRMGVVLGACTGGMLGSEDVVRSFRETGALNPEPLRFHECASSTESVCQTLGLGGYRTTLSTACTSGAVALTVGADLLSSREVDVVLTGGVDSLTRLTLNGFVSLLIVSPDGPRPFDADRKGMSLGEGAAILVLEREADARARRVPILARLAGHGITCDAYHPTAPVKEGQGAARAMSLALEMAALSPGDVDYINAHGTGTRDNDTAEAQAIRTVFGVAPPPVSSTKRFFGHTLAASGAIEAVVSILAIARQRLPPNLGLRTVDPEVGFMPVASAGDAPLESVMSNSFGFGGNNCVLLLSRVDDHASN